MNKMAKAVLCALVAMVSLVGTPARAADWLSWDEFYQYGQSCGYQCTNYEWVENWYCDQYDCYSSLDYVCVEQAYACTNYRLELSDGDIIDYDCASSGTKPDGYEFVLKSAQAITWWKGLKGYRNGYESSFSGEVSTQDSRHESGLLTVIPDNDSAYLTFAKAKFLGAHTDVYKLNIASGMAKGKKCTFTWIRD